MEIFLRIEDEDRVHLADVDVQVGPSHTVADLTEAIAQFLGRETDSAASLDRPVISRLDAGPLVDHLGVIEAGVLSGQTLILGRLWPGPEGRIGELVLQVASGPDAGRTLDMPPGSWLVGRDDDCDLTLTDPQISRRHLRITVGPTNPADRVGATGGGDRVVATGGGDRVTVEVLVGDRNEVRSGGETLDSHHEVGLGQTVRLGASTLVVRRRPPVQHNRADAFGQIPFHRTPHFPTPVQVRKIEALKDVPAKPEKSRFAYLSALLPVLMGVSLAVLFNEVRYLLFAAFSPLMVIGNYFEQRRRTGNKFRESVERFEAELETKAATVHRALAEERARRFAESPDVAALRDRAESRSLDLWVRDREAYNFLKLRVGVGDLPATVEVMYPDSGDAEFRDQIVAAYGETETLTDVPITIDLTELGVVGLVGGVADTTALASSLAIQAAALHSPEDLVIAAAVSPRRAIVDWLKWLPHCRSSSSPLSGPHLFESRPGADELVSELLVEAARRKQFSGGPITFPRLLVLLDRSVEPDAATVSRLLDIGSEAGISVLWLTDSVERVPRQARSVVECMPVGTGRLSPISFTDPDSDDRLADLEQVGPEFAAETSRALAPLRDASSANAATAIPKVVPLFTALGIEAVDADWVGSQWRTDRGYSLQGPIGYTDSGPLILDIVEHGPHGLIGGTSGAGKSELVMSMVAGLIAYNPPNRINFLFIDYKGGASSDLFKNVPHTVGYVTNLDGLLAMRALTSLRAELNRRMNLMQGKAKDLEEMLARYPNEAPASLVIVVDEFATLVQEIPDFVAGIVDIAQRGRSLGIHLMLATQRPSGSVNDNIKANTNLRISLRMLDGGESTAVIGTTDAAAIPAPLKGRGFARMGPGELTAFQSAWAGAPLQVETGRPPVEVAPFGPAEPVDPFGPVDPVDTAGRPDRPHVLTANEPLIDRDEALEWPPAFAIDSDRTQVDALLDAVVAAGERLGYERGRAPWLETLPAVLSLEAVRRFDRADASAGQNASKRNEAKPGSRIVFGMVDDPATQSQYPAVVDLAASGGLLITGTGGSGKSTMLKTAAVSAALDDAALGGGHLTIFAFDFASRALGGLARLPQCGGVAGSDDIEAVTRIIALLHSEFERRRQAQAEAVARAEAPPEHTSVLVLIDGLEAMTQTMEQGSASGLTSGLAEYYTDLTKVISDGRQVGIYPIIATPRQTSVRAGLTSAISARLTLRQADAQGYTDVGIGAADAKSLDLSPGQGFFNGATTVQVARLVPEEAAKPNDGSPDEVERERLTTLAESIAGQVDPRLQTRPLPRAIGLLTSTDPLKPIIGMVDLSCAPLALDLTHNNVSIMGDPRTGRSTALATIGAQAAAGGAEVWALAAPGSALSQFDGATKSCFVEGQDRIDFLSQLVELAEQPQLGSPVPRPRLLLVDDIDLLPEHDRELLSALEKLLGLVRFAVAGSKPRGFSSHPITQLARNCRSVVYLRPHDPREAHEVLGTPVPWHPGLPMVEGRGFLVADRVPVIMQLSNAFLDQS